MLKDRPTPDHQLPIPKRTGELGFGSWELTERKSNAHARSLHPDRHDTACSAVLAGDLPTVATAPGPAASAVVGHRSGSVRRAARFTEAWTTLFGWSPFIFKSWYISGALLGGAPLAQGTVYLLLKRRTAHLLTAALVLYVGVASIAVVVAPIDLSAVEPHRLTGRASSDGSGYGCSVPR